jgi:hypothetical protein
MNSLVIQLVLTCPDSADTCLRKLREVLEPIERAGEPWPLLVQWEQALPRWFVAACSPPMSASEARAWMEQWRAMSPSEQSETVKNQKWSLPDWLYWMESPQSVWRWQRAIVRSPCELEVTLDVDGWPVALGAFDWLARTAGASNVSEPRPADPL